MKATASHTDRARRLRKAGALALAGLFLLSSCVTTGGGSSSAPPGSPQAQLAQRNAQYNSLIAQGCAGGLIAGALLGALLDGGRGAAIGAGAGGLLGCGAGYGLAEQNLSRAETEQVLDDRIQAADTAISDYRQEVQLTNQIVSQERQKIDALKRQLAARQISRDQAERQLAQVDENIQTIRQSLEHGEERVEDLQSEIAELEKAGISTAELRQREQRLRELQSQQRAALNQLVSERAIG